MPSLPTDDRPVDGNGYLLFLTSGVHGNINMIERAINSNCLGGPQAAYECRGAIARLEFCIKAIEQGVPISNVTGYDGRLAELAYPGAFDKAEQRRSHDPMRKVSDELVLAEAKARGLIPDTVCSSPAKSA